MTAEEAAPKSLDFERKKVKESSYSNIQNQVTLVLYIFTFFNEKLSLIFAFFSLVFMNLSSGFVSNFHEEVPKTTLYRDNGQSKCKFLMRI